MKSLFILNDPPYGSERCYNALRLASGLLKKDPQAEIIISLMADSVVAEGWAEEPDGYYNIERMLKRVLTGKGQVLLEPLVHGAGHESGRRAGTESATLAAALGEACVLACNLAPMTHVQALRDHFWSALNHRFGTGVVLNGHLERRLPNTLNVSFVGRVGAELLAHLDGVAASTGSACHGGRVELSPVLEAMGVLPEVGMGAVRFSLGRETNGEEIDEVISRLAGALPSTRESELNL